MRIDSAKCGYFPEPLAAPMGFKGGYLSELWQVAVKLTCENHKGIGCGVQSVLWSDASVFAANSQDSGNQLMLDLTRYALSLLPGREFENPIEMLSWLFPQVLEYGKKHLNKPDLRATFALNALVPVDLAAWQLYSSVKGQSQLTALLPEGYQGILSEKQKAICSVPSITYTMPMDTIASLLKSGYHFLKIKLGADPAGDGDLDKMLAWDMARLEEIHNLAKDIPTDYTEDGFVPYYLDPNGRYDSKDRLCRLLEHADRIGALKRITILEEPFPEENKEDVSDLPVRIAADESAHTVEDAIARMDLGYRGIALKPIAKTLSMTLKILRAARERNVPCFCADLTVNPWMVDWNKNIAARIPPLPGIKLGIMESNGGQNYAAWEKMKTYHPLYGKLPLDPEKGVYHLTEDYYNLCGGIFANPTYYEKLTKR